MEKKPRVLSLYAPFPIKGEDAEIEMKVQAYPHTPQAHFLIYSLKVFFEDKFYTKVKLKENTLTTQISLRAIRSLFFGFNPSKDIAEKLKEMSDQDERTEQILTKLGNLDQEAKYAYIGSLDYRIVLATKKRNFPLLMSLIPQRLFIDNNVSEMRYVVTQEFNKFMGRPQDYIATPKIKRKKISEVREILANSNTPFFAFKGDRHYSFAPIGGRERLPPENLSLIDCFPYKNKRYQDFFEGEPEYKTEANELLRIIKGN